MAFEEGDNDHRGMRVASSRALACLPLIAESFPRNASRDLSQATHETRRRAERELERQLRERLEADAIAAAEAMEAEEARERAEEMERVRERMIAASEVRA